MNILRGFTGLAGLGLSAAVLLGAGGCSCKQTPPPVVHVVQQKAQPPAQQPPQQPAAEVKAPAPKPGDQVGESVLRGPGDYLYTATVTAPRYAKKTIDISYVGREIKEFQALKGRYPKSLEELGEWLGEPVQPAPGGYKYSYDPKTGKLDVVPAE